MTAFSFPLELLGEGTKIGSEDECRKREGLGKGSFRFFLIFHFLTLI